MLPEASCSTTCADSALWFVRTAVYTASAPCTTFTNQLSKTGRIGLLIRTSSKSLFEVVFAFIKAAHAPDSTPQEWVPGGELFHHLDVEGAFDEPTAMFYAANVLLALEFLHSKGIVYRDLKPENLLMDTQVGCVRRLACLAGLGHDRNKSCSTGRAGGQGLGAPGGCVGKHTHCSACPHLQRGRAVLS